jgi:hypothetical protein
MIRSILTRRLAWMPPLLAALAIVPSATAAQPRILMTGDSTIDSIAKAAKQRLEQKRGEARIIHDGRPGEGISRSWRTNWVRYSRFQIRRYRPRATVVMIGANDGFAMLDDSGREVSCCRRAWIDAYARDVGLMMQAYTRRGRFVYWLTLPAPDDERRRTVGLAVNYALRQAAARFDRARLLDMAELFTPGYRFRRRMVVDGKRVVVRERDGVHLNATGAALALRSIRRGLVADGVIR